MKTKYSFETSVADGPVTKRDILEEWAPQPLLASHWTLVYAAGKFCQYMHVTAQRSSTDRGRDGAEAFPCLLNILFHSYLCEPAQSAFSYVWVFLLHLCDENGHMTGGEYSDARWIGKFSTWSKNEWVRSAGLLSAVSLECERNSSESPALRNRSI
jgi:hypothetical protein